MQTAEGALASCIVNENVGKLEVFNFQMQKTVSCSIELFDKGTNVRQPSSLFNHLKLGFFGWWKVSSMSLFWTVKETWFTHIT